MLGFSRTGVKVARLSQQRALSAALAHASTGSSGRSRSSGFNGRDSRSNTKNNNNTKLGSSITKEQMQLQNKYKTSLNSSKIESLYDVIELVEWRGNVYSPVLTKVVELSADSTSALNSLTDRQLAVVLSVFGDRGESIGRPRRLELLNKTLEAIQGRGVVLGSLSKDAVLAARLDNGDSVNVVEELQKWEASGLTPSADTYQQLARAYAVQGNTQGVVDIINHMKQEGLTVTQLMVESMIRSMARTGSYKQAETILLKFLPAMNEVGLRCSLALGAIANGDASQVVNTLTSMSGNAKQNIVDNNVLILQVLFEMLEAGVPNAVEMIRPFLTTVPDGTTLTEWHQNSAVVARARRARSEGRLEAAISMYSIVHPNFKNTQLEELLMESIGYQLRQKNCDIKSIFSVAKQMEKSGILNDHLMFLLESSVSFGSEHVKNIFLRVKEAGKLQEYLTAKPSLKRSLAKRLSNHLSSSASSSISDRASSIADISMVLFSPRSGDNDDHMSDFYPIIYALGGRDVDIVPHVIQLLEDPRLRKEYSTAVLSGILSNGDDPLKKDKLLKLVQCSDLDFNLWHTNTQFKLVRLINNNDKLLAVDEQMKLIAKIIALSFPAAEASARGYHAYAVQNLGNLLASQSLSVENVTSLVDALENEANVSLSYDDLQSLKNILKDNSKLEAVSRLKRSHQTHSRWKAATVEELEAEFDHLSQSEKVKPGLLSTIQHIILQKMLVQQPPNLQAAVRHLTAVAATPADTNSRVHAIAGRVFDVAFTAALRSGNAQVMHDLWQAKSSFTAVHALSYIAVLFTRGDTERADSVCKELRKSAQLISNRSLSVAGEMVGDIEKSKMDELTAYLVAKFNLKPYQSRKLVEQVKMRQLRELIAQGNLVDAMVLAKEESSAAGAAFGQFDLFAAAFKRDDHVLASNVYSMVQNCHDKNIAVLDLGFAMLEAGLKEQAARTLSTSNVTISTRKLESFMIRSTNSGRADVLHGLFSSLSEGSRASNVDLNKLVVQLSRMYYNANDQDSLNSLMDEIQRKSFPMEEQIRRIYADVQKKRSASTARTPARESSV